MRIQELRHMHNLHTGLSNDCTSDQSSPNQTNPNHSQHSQNHNQLHRTSITNQRCSELLDACKFAEFWTTFKTVQEEGSQTALAKAMVGKVQKGIASVLALSYRSAPASVIETALNLPDTTGISTTLKDVVESVKGNVVTFRATSDNTKRERVFEQGVDFSTISNLMSKASVATQ